MLEELAGAKGTATGSEGIKAGSGQEGDPEPARDKRVEAAIAELSQPLISAAAVDNVPGPAGVGSVKETAGFSSRLTCSMVGGVVKEEATVVSRATVVAVLERTGVGAVLVLFMVPGVSMAGEEAVAVVLEINMPGADSCKASLTKF